MGGGGGTPVELEATSKMLFLLVVSQNDYSCSSHLVLTVSDKNSVLDSGFSTPIPGGT